MTDYSADFIKTDKIALVFGSPKSGKARIEITLRNSFSYGLSLYMIDISKIINMSHMFPLELIIIFFKEKEKRSGLRC